MKRFALTICLAACLMFALSAPALGDVTCTVASGSGGTSAEITCGVYLANTSVLRGVIVPLVIRSVSGGAYPSAILIKYNPAGRLDLNGALRDQVSGNTYLDEDGTCKQGLPGGFGTIDDIIDYDPTGYPVPSFDSVAVVSSPSDPDALLFARNWVSSIRLNPGDDIALGPPSMLIEMNLGTAIGEFCIDTTCTNPANHLLFVLASDGSADPNVTFVSGCWEVLADQCPAFTADPGDVSVTVGSGTSVQIQAVDSDATPGGVQYCIVSGEGQVDANGLYTYDGDCDDVPGFDVEIGIGDASNACPCASRTFHVTVNPTALVLTSCGDVSEHWGDLAAQTVGVSGGCPPYVFSGGAPGAVDPGTGDWTYMTDCGDLGTVGVTVTVTDDVGQTIDCDFDLTATNSAPVCTDPANKFFGTLDETSQILGPMTDVDGDGLTYILQSGPTGGYILDNEFIWERPDGEIDDELVVFTVSDGCEESDPCDFYATFEPFGLEWNICVVKPGVFNGAEGEECDQSQWTFYPDSSYITELYGRNVTAAVHVEHLAEGEAGGFDFLICYDQSALTFLGASRGPGLLCGWEYFTWRTGLFGGNCGGACPDGYIRLVGIADMNDGHDLDPSAGKLGGWDIAYLTFFITQDVNFVGTCPHIGFCSFDCTDNVISSKDGNFLALPYLTDNPGWSGGIDYPDDCADLSPIDPITQQPKAKIARLIRFCASAICVGEPDDDRGDMNLNGIPNEIGDAVVYSNYFIQGGWGDYDFPDVREFASDINNDGLTLTIADLVYLIRIITGDEQPFTDEHENPKVSPYANAVDVITDVRNGSLTVRTNASVDLGGALLVYRYSNLTVGAAEFNADGMVMRSQARNGELRIVVYPDVASEGSKISSGLNDLVTIPVEGNGTIDLVESQFSDLNGAMLSVQAAKVAPPTSYALHQNFPNPFNAGTVIPLSLKNGGEWNLTIYNVAGQVVRTFSGADEAGTINVRWDGRGENGESVASGMYFYRATADEFTATKKMVVLK